MAYSPFEKQHLEHACVQLSRALYELLQQKKIDAQEFLSIVGNLPIKPIDRPTYRWFS